MRPSDSERHEDGGADVGEQRTPARAGRPAAQADDGPAGCWAGLLRGDARLLKLLTLLQPLALATEPEAEAPPAEGGALAAAAAAWRDATR